MAVYSNPLLGTEASSRGGPTQLSLGGTPQKVCGALASVALLLAGAVLFLSAREPTDGDGPSHLATGPLRGPSREPSTIQLAATSTSRAAHLNLTQLFNEASGEPPVPSTPKFGVTDFLCGFGEGNFESLESGVAEMVKFVEASALTASDGRSDRSDVLAFLGPLRDSGTLERIFRSTDPLYQMVPKTGDGIMTLLMLLHAVAREGREVSAANTGHHTKTISVHVAKTLQLGGGLQVMTLADGSLYDASPLPAHLPSPSLSVEMDCQRECTGTSSVLTYSCQALFDSPEDERQSLQGDAGDAGSQQVKATLESAQTDQADVAATLEKARRAQSSTTNHSEAASRSEDEVLAILENASALQTEVDTLLGEVSREERLLQQCEAERHQAQQNAGAQQAECDALGKTLQDALSDVQSECQGNDAPAASTQLAELDSSGVDSSADETATAPLVRPEAIQWNITRQVNSESGCDVVTFQSLNIGLLAMVHFLEGSELKTARNKNGGDDQNSKSNQRNNDDNTDNSKEEGRTDKAFVHDFLSPLRSLNIADKIFRPERKIFSRMPAMTDTDVVTLLVLLLSVARDGQDLGTIPLNESTDVSVTLRTAKTLQLWDSMQVATRADGSLYDASALSSLLPSPDLHIEVDCQRECSSHAGLTFHCLTTFPFPREQNRSDAEGEVSVPQAKSLLEAASASEAAAQATLQEARREEAAAMHRSAVASHSLSLAQSIQQRAVSSKHESEARLLSLKQQRKTCQAALDHVQDKSSSTCSKTLLKNFTSQVRQACAPPDNTGKSSSGSRGRSLPASSWLLLLIAAQLASLAR